MTTAPIFGEVYVHTCTANEKSYVGQTTQGTGVRWKEHVRHSQSPKCVDFKYPLVRAIRKYGSDAFESQTLSVAKTKKELDNLERVWIILLQTRTSGYNVAAGGEGHLGLRHGATALAQMSAAKMGNKHCVGRKISLETRNKLSAAIAGRSLTPEWKQKISVAGCGRRHSAETKAKIAVSNTGKIFSPETRAKMSASAKLRCARKEK